MKTQDKGWEDPKKILVEKLDMHLVGNEFTAQNVIRILEAIKSTKSQAKLEEMKKYDSIFKWLLGEEGDFPDLSQPPHYSFRSELRKRLSILNEQSQ